MTDQTNKAAPTAGEAKAQEPKAQKPKPQEKAQDAPAKGMARVEVLVDGEIFTGQRAPALQRFHDGDVIELPVSVAQSHIAARRARKSAKAVHVQTADEIAERDAALEEIEGD